MRSKPVLVLVLCFAACTPHKLLKATVEYAKTTDSVSAELQAAPAILNELCHDSMEIQYATERVISGEKVGTLREFGKRRFPSASGNVQITWEQRCKGLELADAAFLRGISAIEQYAVALGAFAGGDFAAEDNIKALAAASADAAQRLSPEAQAYHSAIKGLGTPLSAIAKAVEGKWKASKLTKLVVATDPPLHQVVTQLQDFIATVRKRHVNDVREGLADLVHSLDQVRTPADHALGVETSRLDIDLSNRLDALDARLKQMSSTLERIAIAHTELAQGWQRGESQGLSTLKAMGTFARDMYQAIEAFKHPAKGAEP